MRPVVICLDVEPDARTFALDRPSGWDGFERLLAELPAIRRRLADLNGHPVRLSWFLRMDPQIAESFGSATWIAERYTDAVAGLRASGDEIGIHTHDWRWSDDDGGDGGGWHSLDSDPEWQARCVETSLGAFEQAFGERCAVHRAGDRQLTAPMVEALIRGGVEVDLTPEPGLAPMAAYPGENGHGLTPDYRGIPTVPYRSTPERYPMPSGGVEDSVDAAGPLLVPLFSARGRWARRNPLPLLAAPWRFRLALASERLPRGAPLAFAVRSDIALHPNAFGRVVANLERLAGRSDTRFVTASQAAAAWRAENSV